MTREEFTTRFNAILANPTDTATAATFRDEVLKDYDDANAAATTLKTANESITKLQDENKNLKEVNYKMFLSGFNTANVGSDNKDDKSSKEDKKDEQKPEAPTVDSVIDGLLGKEKE